MDACARAGQVTCESSSVDRLLTDGWPVLCVVCFEKLRLRPDKYPNGISGRCATGRFWGRVQRGVCSWSHGAGCGCPHSVWFLTLPLWRAAHTHFAADPDRSFGRESRSLKAAYEFLQVTDVGGGLAQTNCMHMHLGPLLPASCCHDTLASSHFTPPASPHALLHQAGWNSSNLMWVDGGLAQWRYEGLPVESGPDPDA